MITNYLHTRYRSKLWFTHIHWECRQTRDWWRFPLSSYRSMLTCLSVNRRLVNCYTGLPTSSSLDVQLSFSPDSERSWVGGCCEIDFKWVAENSFSRSQSSHLITLSKEFGSSSIFDFDLETLIVDVKGFFSSFDSSFFTPDIALLSSSSNSHKN